MTPKLPKLPENEWTRAKIVRPSTGAHLEITATNYPLPEIETVYHDQKIDVLSKRHRSNVHEVFYSGRPAISKIAAFDWDIPRLERETWAYSILGQYQRLELSEPQISPRVLGHLTECAWVIGIMLERLDGEFASAEDLPAGEKALRRFHEIGLIHGDVNRYIFIVDRRSGQLRTVDFEHAAALDVDEAAAEVELQSLESELREERDEAGLQDL